MEPYRQIKVSGYQHKMNSYLWDVICKSHGSHKAKVESRFIKPKNGAGGHQAYHHGKPWIYKETEIEGKRNNGDTRQLEVNTMALMIFTYQ